MFVPKSIGDLERIIKEGLEETERLEFKKHLPESGKNDDIAKDVSAMANAEGGVIIYGVEEDKTGRALELHPLPLSGVVERVNMVVNSNLDEPVLLEDIFTLEQEEGKGYLVVVVPKSERAPHIFNGCAFGRVSKGNVPLNRRRIGELFARSPGFAEEFGLIMKTPGRIHVRSEVESYIYQSSKGKEKTRYRYYLVLLNDGNSEVTDISLEIVSNSNEDEESLPKLLNDPFPVDVMPPEAEFKVKLSPGEIRNFYVKVFWKEKKGERREGMWPITLLA